MIVAINHSEKKKFWPLHCSKHEFTHWAPKRNRKILKSQKTNEQSGAEYKGVGCDGNLIREMERRWERGKDEDSYKRETPSDNAE